MDPEKRRSPLTLDGGTVPPPDRLAIFRGEPNFRAQRVTSRQAGYNQARVTAAVCRRTARAAGGSIGR